MPPPPPPKPAAPGNSSNRRAEEAGAGRADPVRPPGDVDLVRREVRRRQHLADRRPRQTATGSAPSTSRPATRGDSWSQFNPGLVEAAPQGRPRRLRLAVRLRRQPDGRGQGRRRVGRRRRRLPGDRRRGPVRGQVRLGRPLHPRPAQADRAQLPALAGRLPLRRLPPGLPLLGLLRARRRHLQPAADVLEGDRNLGPHASSSTPTSTTASGTTRSTRSARPTAAPGRKSIQLFRRFAESYGGLEPSWWDWQETTTAGWKALGADLPGPITGYRPSHRATRPCKTRQPRRPRRLGAGAPALGRPERPGDRRSSASTTRAAVRDFQDGAGLPVDGVIGTSTWRSLLKYQPIRCLWGGRRPKRGPPAPRAPPRDRRRAARSRPRCPPRPTRSTPARGPSSHPEIIPRRAIAAHLSGA